MDVERARDTGFWVGMGAFALLGLGIYIAYRLLLHRVGDEWATLALYVPAFCAVFVIAPVQHRYEAFARRRYCRLHGHEPAHHSDGAREVVICDRCGFVLQRPSPTPASRTN